MKIKSIKKTKTNGLGEVRLQNLSNYEQHLLLNWLYAEIRTLLDYPLPKLMNGTNAAVKNLKKFAKTIRTQWDAATQAEKVFTKVNKGYERCLRTTRPRPDFHSLQAAWLTAKENIELTQDVLVENINMYLDIRDRLDIQIEATERPAEIGVFVSVV